MCSAVLSRNRKENLVAIKEEANKREVEGLRKHAEVHIMNEDEASEEEILSWVRSEEHLRRDLKGARIRT